MEIRIKAYEEKDAQALKESFLGLQEQTVSIDQCNFYRAVKDFDTEEYTKAFVKNIEASGQMIFVAEADGEIVGHMVVGVETLSKKEKLEFYCKKRGKIIELFIKPEFQSKGIGSKMMEKAEVYFKEQDCNWITLQAIHGNEGTLQFYKNHGYTEHAVEFLKRLHRRDGM